MRERDPRPPAEDVALEQLRAKPALTFLILWMAAEPWQRDVAEAFLRGAAGEPVREARDG